MNILVTGGLGFIGSNLVDNLVRQGHNVIVIDDCSTGLDKNKNPNAKYIKKNITEFIGKDNTDLYEIFFDCEIETVYHLAAFTDVRESFEDPNLVFQINHLASVSFLETSIKAKVKKFIFASTSAVYGEPLYLPVDESHPLNPISPYGLSKLSFEQYAQERKNHSTSVVIFRLPNVYGKRQRSDLEGGVVSIFFDRMVQDKEVIVFGDGNQTRDWVHVEDIVSAFNLARESSSIPDFFLACLGTGGGKTLIDLFNMISKITNYSREPHFLESKKGDIKHMSLSGEICKKHLDWTAKISLYEGVKSLV